MVEFDESHMRDKEAEVFNEVRSLVRYAIHVLARLEAVDRECMFRRMAGDDLNHIAAVVRVVYRKPTLTSQAVHNRIKRVLRDSPVWRAILSETVEKQKRRKRHGKDKRGSVVGARSRNYAHGAG